VPLCAPWIEAENISACDGCDIEAERLERAARAASELLYAASGRQFHGLCTDVVRPCSRGWAQQWLAYPDGSSRPLPLDGDLLPIDCGCGSLEVTCGCAAPDAVRLPNRPVVEVKEILVDGAPLAPTDWTLIDDQWLARPGGWPWRQRLDLPATEPDTWQVTYTWGTAVPEAGVLAAEVLACELAKSWAGTGSCRLPKRVQNIVREGVTMTVMDQFEFLDDGMFGVYEVDTFIATFNPHRLQGPARMIVPRFAGRRARRVR
jgi:hypothetical protein